jgi:uncharacterized protein YdhG (YjbR/CyaY superfamily)
MDSKSWPSLQNHDEYIVAAAEQFRPLLGHLRFRLAEVLPDADELVMYDMPGFGFGKSIIAGYAAFSKQCGLHVSNGAIAAHADGIAAAGLKSTQTGVTFLPHLVLPPFHRTLRRLLFELQ